jgi:SAM-dependent methyltransferase
MLNSTATDHKPLYDWPSADEPALALDCPNCGSIAPKHPVVTVHYETPTDRGHDFHLFRCQDCGCAFYSDLIPPPYDENGISRDWVTRFYLQQGAGISLLARAIGQVARPDGCTFLDVGCGFGFGLDFAIHGMGWKGEGIDPAPMARLGRARLGVPIHDRYLRDDEAELLGSRDIVLSSETLEHVPSPPAFVATLKRILRPDGILVVTTPDAAAIEPGVSVGLLGPGVHLVLQTRESLGPVRISGLVSGET